MGSEDLSAVYILKTALDQCIHADSESLTKNTGYKV